MNLRRHGSKEWVTGIDKRLNGFRQAYEDLKLNGFGQAYGACKFYHADRSRQHGCWQLIANAATQSIRNQLHVTWSERMSGATATVKCYINTSSFSKILVNIKRYLEVTIGRKAYTFTMHTCLLWNYRHRFVVLTPSISILFTLGQFVAQNHTVSINRH